MRTREALTEHWSPALGKAEVHSMGLEEANEGGVSAKQVSGKAQLSR